MLRQHLINNIAVHDIYLKNLLQEYGPSVIGLARRTNTLKTYKTYYNKWVWWTERYSEVSPLPTEEKYVGIYLLDLIKQGETFNVINMSWFAIKAYHKFCGYEICKSFFCINIYEGAKRTLQCIPNKKSPITPKHLFALFKLFKKENINLKDLRTLAICVISYTGFLRFSEISNLRREDLEIHDDYMRIFLEQSKTDIYRSGHWIYISKIESVLCPVKLIKKYIDLAKIKEGRNEYLFRAVTKTKQSYELRIHNKPISYTSVREDVLNALEKLGLRSSDFGLHSLRSGGCSMATHFGVKEKLIKKHGRWKSERVKDGYTHPTLKELLLISKNLGL